MAKIEQLNRDGSTVLVDVKVGDVVNFKSDYEQRGTVAGIDGDWLTLTNPNGFGGEYLRYRTTTRQHATDCWK